MNKALKITLILAAILAAAALVFFITPMKAWKKYQAQYPALFEVQDEATPTYLAFCKSYWKTMGKVIAGKEEEITYSGGLLPDLEVVAPKI